MRTTQVVFTLILLAVPLVAQQPAATSSNATQASGQYGDQKLHASAVKFLEASDARERLQQVLGNLLDDGRRDLLQRNQGLDPRFADEWEKRMRTRVSVDDFVNATAQVYEKYFTSEELDELAQAQVALKKGEILTLPEALGKKLKVDSALIQHDINIQTSLIGARLGKEVGQEIEKEHPEWGKNTGPATAPAAKK